MKNAFDHENTEQELNLRTDLNPNAEHYIYHMKNENMVTHLDGASPAKEDIELILKKRRSAIRYAFPVEWTEGAYWTVKVDFSQYEFSMGTWDYYIKDTNDDLKRISVENEIAFEELAPLYCPANKGSKVIRHYKTEKGNASFVSDKIDVHLSGIRTAIPDKQNVAISGRLEGLPIWQHQSSQQIYMTLRERNSRDTTDMSCELEWKEGKYHQLECQLDYDALVSNDADMNRRWDVFLHLYIDGVYRAFQLALMTEQIAADSRVQFDDDALHQMYFYQTVDNHMALCYTDVPMKLNVDKYKLSKNNLYLRGYALLDALSLSEKETIERFIIVKERETEEESYISLKNGKNAQKEFDISIPLKDLQPDVYEIYDLYIEIRYKNIIKRRKLGCEPYTYHKDEILAKTIQTKQFRKLYVSYYLTFTPKGNLKIEAFTLTYQSMKYLKKGQYKSRAKNKDEDVWLIGERPDTAQDTGYHFFRYCRMQYPEKQIYYVIDSNSDDIVNVEDLANVLYWGSEAHFKKAANASVLIGSHDLEYILPIKNVDLASYKSAKKVFLQHGVLGRKSAEYHKYYYKHPFDMFCVSSTSEKKLVHKKMDYDIDEVNVTGLSRFDNLLKSHTEKRSILIIPTWREWLNDESAFTQSEYFNRYKRLLESEQLRKMLDKYDVELTFYLHYRMQPFIDQFDIASNNRIKVVSQGEQNVQELLLENKLMVTDYSSVSFDFNYMSKPVVFYHFDQDSFFKNGRLRPIEETFLGDICIHEQDVLDSVETYIQTDFAEKEEVKDKKYLVFDHIDQKNCKRIYDAIQAL